MRTSGTFGLASSLFVQSVGCGPTVAHLSPIESSPLWVKLAVLVWTPALALAVESTGALQRS